MENATKALMMVGSLLIGLLIIGLLVFTFKNIKQAGDEDRDSILTEQVNQFNKRFTAYEKQIRGNELYSLINRMLDYNQLLEDYKNTNKQTSHDKMDIKITIQDPGKTFHFHKIFTQTTYNLEFFNKNISLVGRNCTLREHVEEIELDGTFGGQNKLQALVSEFDTYGNAQGTGFQSDSAKEEFRKKLEELRI